MKIWSDGNKPTEECLKILGRTKEEIPIAAAACAITVYIPTDETDRVFLDSLRETFRNSSYRKDRFFCLVENNGKIHKVVTLIANENHLAAPVAPDR